MYAGLALRIACSFLGDTDISDMSLDDKEHWTRVWWTTWQLDTMTAFEMGLKSTFLLENLETSLPSARHIACSGHAEFSDPRILTAHIKLCSTRIEVLKTAKRPRVEDAVSFQGMIRDSLRQLQQWLAELPKEYFFEFHNGPPSRMLEMESVRSLASIYLRYHQVSFNSTQILIRLLNHTSSTFFLSDQSF